MTLNSSGADLASGRARWDARLSRGASHVTQQHPVGAGGVRGSAAGEWTGAVTVAIERATWKFDDVSDFEQYFRNIDIDAYEGRLKHSNIASC